MESRPSPAPVRAALLPLFALALLAAAPARAQPTEPPEAVYAKYHRALLAGSADEAARYVPEAQKKELAALSAEDKLAAMRRLSQVVPRSYLLKSKAVEVKDFRVRLVVSGPGQLRPQDKPEILYGAIRMDVENGAWKVAESRWSTTPPVAVNVVRGFGAGPAPATVAPGLPALPTAAQAASIAPKAAPATAKPAPMPAKPVAGAAHGSPPGSTSGSTPSRAATGPASRPNAVGNTVERPLGAAKPKCVFKPVMSAEDLALCK